MSGTARTVTDGSGVTWTVTLAAGSDAGAGAPSHRTELVRLRSSDGRVATAAIGLGELDRLTYGDLLTLVSRAMDKRRM